jgi:16S rRNA (guanine527-N7)-methyltransferase
MKGNSALKEIEEGAFAIQVLGGKFAAMYPIVLPEVEAPHMLLTIEKNEETPKKYPRAVGMPAKRPLVLKQDAKGRPKPESFDDDDEEA